MQPLLRLLHEGQLPCANQENSPAWQDPLHGHRCLGSTYSWGLPGTWKLSTAQGTSLYFALLTHKQGSSIYLPGPLEGGKQRARQRHLTRILTSTGLSRERMQEAVRKKRKEDGVASTCQSLRFPAAVRCALLLGKCPTAHERCKFTRAQKQQS